MRGYRVFRRWKNETENVTVMATGSKPFTEHDELRLPVVEERLLRESMGTNRLFGIFSEDIQ